jgi:molybdopterin-containing oxidoreductase family membrane subunit
MRYDLVIGGQLVPMREGVDGLVNGLLTYTPSITELGIVIGAMAFCLLLYSIAEKFLYLGEQKH